MANRIEINIIANDKTGSELDKLSQKLLMFGSAVTRLVSDPLTNLLKDLFKTDEMKEALAPIKEAFDEVLQELVTALGPVIERLTPFLLSLADILSDIVKWFSELDAPMQNVVIGFIALLTVIGPLIVFIGLILPALGALAAALGVTVGALLGIIAAVAAVVTALIVFWPQIQLFCENVALWFRTAFENARDWVISTFTTIKEFITTTLETIKTFISTKLSEIKNAILDKVSEWKQAGKDLIMGLVNGVKEAAGRLISAVTGAVGSAIEGAKRLLGISSPSKVFQDIGANMMEGWAKGIKMNASPQIAIQGATAGMVTAAAPPSRGEGGATVILQYSPVVSMADRYEAETKLVPYIESALKKLR